MRSLKSQLRTGDVMIGSWLTLGHPANAEIVLRFEQFGITAFRSGFLARFTRLQAGPLEAIELVEMLTALDHKFRLRMVLTGRVSIGAERPADLQHQLAAR